MRSALNHLLILLACGVMLAGCDKDNRKLYAEYPDAGEISFTLTGSALGYKVNMDQTYKLFWGAYDNYLTRGKDFLVANRYSDDFQSEISLRIHFDTTDNSTVIPTSYLNYTILNVNADHTVMTLQAQVGDSSVFSNFSYDPDKRIASGDFNFTVNQNSEELTMAGNFRLNIYNDRFFSF